MISAARCAFVVCGLVLMGCGARADEVTIVEPTEQPAVQEPDPPVTLQETLAQGDHELAVTLIEQGASTELVDLADAQGCALLIEAVGRASEETLASVLALTADTIAQCDAEELVLAALETDSDQILHSLLDSDLDLEVGSVHSMPWIVFAGGGHCTLVSHLLGQGIDPDEADSSGRTALYRAAAVGDVTCVKLLLDAGADPEHETDAGQSIIEAAVDGGHGDAYLVLSEVGMKIDKADVQDGFLSFVKAGHVPAAGEMLKKGAKVNAIYGDKQTAIYHAIDAQQGEMVEYLVEQGCSTELRDQAGWKPIHFATYRGYLPMVVVLVQIGADVDGKGGDGKTALMHAVTQGHTELTEKLIELGADLDHQDKEGKTALMYAATVRHTPGVKALLDAGADKTLLSETGKDALFYASKASSLPVDPEIVSLLE